jgi:hypothetical protein
MQRLAQMKIANGRGGINRPAWLAWWLQKRRRKRAVPVPNIPVFTGNSWIWDQTEVGWADIYLEFSFDHGSFPVGTLEVWFHREGTAPPELLGNILSTQTDFWHMLATPSEEFLFYTLRYVGDGVTGPFCNELTVVPWHLPGTPGGLGGSSDEGGSTLLTWDMDGVSYEDGSSVEGRKGADPFVELATTGPDVDSVTLGVPAGTWEFRVRTFNAHGFSDYTNSVFVTVN